MRLEEKGGIRTYLTFTLGDETFGVDVANVREVVEMVPVTRVPRTPDFLRGVINLRGTVVPVVDMRVKFGLPPKADDTDTCIVVLEIELEGELATIGALADSVREVFDLDGSGIEPPPRIGTRLDIGFIRGMARRDDRFVIILDTGMVFSASEVALAGGLRPSAAPEAPPVEPPAP